MRAGDCNQHNLVRGRQRAYAMDHQHIKNVEASPRLCDDGLQRLGDLPDRDRGSARDPATHHWRRGQFRMKVATAPAWHRRTRRGDLLPRRNRQFDTDGHARGALRCRRAVTSRKRRPRRRPAPVPSTPAHACNSPLRHDHTGPKRVSNASARARSTAGTVATTHPSPQLQRFACAGRRPRAAAPGRQHNRNNRISCE